MALEHTRCTANAEKHVKRPEVRRRCRWTRRSGLSCGLKADHIARGSCKISWYRGDLKSRRKLQRGTIGQAGTDETSFPKTAACRDVGAFDALDRYDDQHKTLDLTASHEIYDLARVTSERGAERHFCRLIVTYLRLHWGQVVNYCGYNTRVSFVTILLF